MRTLGWSYRGWFLALLAAFPPPHPGASRQSWETRGKPRYGSVKADDLQLPGEYWSYAQIADQILKSKGYGKASTDIDLYSLASTAPLSGCIPESGVLQNLARV